MRKALLGTTALVATGLAVGAAPAEAADPIKLSLGGYYQVFVVGRSQDEVNLGVHLHNVDVIQEGEVWFVGETTLDNGVKVGVNIQLEAQNAGDQIDEHYVYFSGGFGRLIIGAENSAPYLMQYSAPTGTSGLGVNSPNHVLFRTPSLNNAQTSTFLNLVSDANKITYFTPRFAPGFQFGFSYTPDISDISRSGTGGFGITSDNNDNSFDHNIGVGVNFVRTVGSVDIAVAGGYEHGFLEQCAPINGSGPGAGGCPTRLRFTEGWDAFSGGFNLGIGGWTVGASMAYLDGGGDSSGRLAVDAGVSYGIGPWLIGLAGLYGQTDEGWLGSGPGAGVNPYRAQDTIVRIELGATYTLGPGIRLVGALQYVTWDGFEGPAVPYTVNADQEEADGIGIAFGTAISF